MTTASTSDEFYFDEAAAQRACDFFRLKCRHSIGPFAGKPFVLEKWQSDQLVRPIFGWKRKGDGARKIRTVYLEVPRKNGKSTLAAGLANYLLFADKELGAQVYSAAADTDQASICFTEARRMVEADAQLFALAKIFKKAITVPETNSVYKVLSADAFTKHGLNAHGIIFDELHAQPNRDLWDVLVTSTGSRRQPLTIAITTAGYDRNSICWELHDYAIKVRDGIVEDTSFLPLIFAADEDDDWKSPETWKKANPNLGVSVSLDYFERECKKAQNVPAYENTFKRLHLNIWTEQDVRWMPMDLWDLCDVYAPA